MNVNLWKRCETLIKHVDQCWSITTGNTGPLRTLKSSRQVPFRPPMSFCVQRYFHVQSIYLSNRAKVSSEVTETEGIQRSQEIVQAVNSSINSEDLGRLFAVVHLAGFQRKVTVNDIVVVETSSYPTVGTRVKLEKVLLVGSKDFTLLGKPLLSRSVVNIEATVIEKTLSSMLISFLMLRRKRVKKTRMQKRQHTVLLINSIEVAHIEN
ncbi:39S ribosomal protein L21, mitochondrial-like [Ostrea edulis]|uniref:39S ribosomal protein L21, mitochondrial-like n=1 Tax=Ostrea edulis TaxID=37623 RepID=UPI0024AF3815|nr:39S ribosomal protein L21, mitochondrial-like [Ostrea edulis]